MTVVNFPKSMTTREAVEVVVGVDRESVMEFVNALTPQQVAIFALRVDAVRKLLADAKTYAFMSLDTRGMTGQVFTDPDTSVRYLFRSKGRHRMIPDYEPFLRALADLGWGLVRLAPYLSAGTAVKLQTLEDAEPDAVPIVAEFHKWDDAPPSLLELDARGKIKR